MILRCGDIEIVHDQQGIFPQTAQEPVMPLESGIVTLVWHIVCKVQIDHSLLQIAGIIYIDDIGVFLAILLCISLGKLTFADTGNAVQKHLTVIHQQGMKLFQLLLPPKEPPARSGDVGIENIVHNSRGEIARCQKLLLPHIPLFKAELHRKAEDFHYENRFIVFILKSISVCQLHLLLRGHIGSLQHKVIQFLGCHGTIGHHRQQHIFNAANQLPLIEAVLVEADNIGT